MIKKFLLALLLGFMAAGSIFLLFLASFIMLTFFSARYKSPKPAPTHAEKLIDSISAQRRFDMCRSEMENRPFDPRRDGAYPKTTNSIGFGAYPPSQQVGVWNNLNCSQIPGIYLPFE